MWTVLVVPLRAERGKDKRITSSVPLTAKRVDNPGRRPQMFRLEIAKELHHLSPLGWVRHIRPPYEDAMADGDGKRHRLW